MERPDKETLQYIMRSMTTNNRQLQREILDKYITDDIKFTHFLGDVKGKEAYQGVYRAATTGINYKLLFIEMVISDHLVAAWVDLNIKLAPTYIKRYHAPTIVLLRLRKGEDGLYRICEQIDHHSVFAFMWALGWPISAIADNIQRPIGGWILSTTGWMIDTLEDAADAAWVISLGLIGRLAKTLLPAAVLEALPDLVAGHLGLRPEVKDSSSAEAAAIQRVMNSINGLLRTAGLSSTSSSSSSTGSSSAQNHEAHPQSSSNMLKPQDK